MRLAYLLAEIPTQAQQPMAERHGGWIMAFCLHVILFAGLMMQKDVLPTRTSAPIPKPISISLMAPAPPKPVRLEPVQATQAAAASASETASVEAAPVLGETLEATAQTERTGAEVDGLEGAPAAVSPASPAAVDDEPVEFLAGERVDPPSMTGMVPAHPESREAFEEKHHEVLEALNKRGQQMERAVAYEGMSGSQKIAERIRLARTDQAAARTLFSSGGAHSGAVREIDITGVSGEEAQKVLDRYGMKIILMDINSGAKNGGFLNRATTSQGVFVNQMSRGRYQVFSFSQTALAHMARLEQEALRKEGYDPQQARVTHVIFGIVSTTEGYDLGIKRIHIDPLSGADMSFMEQPVP